MQRLCAQIFLTDGLWVSVVTKHSGNPRWDVCHFYNLPKLIIELKLKLWKLFGVYHADEISKSILGSGGSI